MVNSQLSHFANRIVGQSMFRILETAKEMEQQGINLVHFEIGDSHLEMPIEVKKNSNYFP